MSELTREQSLRPEVNEDKETISVVLACIIQLVFDFTNKYISGNEARQICQLFSQPEAKEAGIQVVVDFIEHDLFYIALTMDGIPELMLQTNTRKSAEKWQAFKKKWGL